MKRTDGKQDVTQIYYHDKKDVAQIYSRVTRTIGVEVWHRYTMTRTIGIKMWHKYTMKRTHGKKAAAQL